MENNRQERFLESVKKQNYSNFHLILCDDNSNDETVNFTERYLRIPENDQLRNRTTLLPSATRKYSLYHKNKAIVEYCSHGSIIIDVDADD